VVKNWIATLLEKGLGVQHLKATKNQMTCSTTRVWRGVRGFSHEKCFEEIEQNKQFFKSILTDDPDKKRLDLLEDEVS